MYASGQYVDAVEYFDKVITYYDKPLPKSNIRKIIDLIYHFILGLKMIYFYGGPPVVEADKISHKLLVIIERKSKALVSLDPKRMFFETFYGFRLVTKKSFGNYEASCLIGTSLVFPFTGLLPKYGKKLEEFAIQHIEESYILGWVWSKYAHCVHSHYAGQKMKNLEEDKFYKLGIQIGEHWPVTTFYVYGGFNIIDSGDEILSLHFLKRLKEVSEAFDTNYSIVQYHRLNAFYNLRFRKIDDSLKASEITIDLAKKTDHALTLLIMYCYQSMAYSYASDFGKAKISFDEASKHIKNFKIPLCMAQYLISKSYIEINNFTERKDSYPSSKAMLKTTSDLLKQAKKIRSNLTEAHRLRAIVFHLLNKPSRALNHFDKSIKAAFPYNGKLELSRTYFEAGKFLRDHKNKKQRINGMNATECLMKAKSMFEEKNLEWDLNEYKKYMEG